MRNGHLLAGVTTIRDVGAVGFSDVAVRDAINDGEIPGPRILASGPPLGITGGHCDDNMLAPEFQHSAEGVADGVVGVRLAVRRNVKYGVDVIKFCGTGGVFSKGDTPGAQQYTFRGNAGADRRSAHGRPQGRRARARRERHQGRRSARASTRSSTRA